MDAPWTHNARWIHVGLTADSRWSLCGGTADRASAFSEFEAWCLEFEDFSTKFGAERQLSETLTAKASVSREQNQEQIESMRCSLHMEQQQAVSFVDIESRCQKEYREAELSLCSELRAARQGNAAITTEFEIERRVFRC